MRSPSTAATLATCGILGVGALLLCFAASSDARALLFFDGEFLSATSGINFTLGTPHLLSEYRDPTSFVGWGYPSVWPARAPAAAAAVAGSATQPKWNMMYQGWFLKGGKPLTKVGLMAQSNDAVRWFPASTNNVSNVTRRLCGPPLENVSNCVTADGNQEFSVVYDDTLHTTDASKRLKLLWFGNCTTSVSDGSGQHWRAIGRWTAASIDGAWVYRNPLNTEEIVITGRPQSLRKLQGRHAGYHAAIGWEALATGNITRALPLDELYTPTDQVYGLPSFSYAGMVVTYFWRYRCPEQNSQCYLGGFVSSALAYSYNSRNWTAFGQFDPMQSPGMTTGRRQQSRQPRPPPPPPPPAKVQLPELFPNRPQTASAGQIYPNTLIDLPNEGRILIHASVGSLLACVFTPCCTAHMFDLFPSDCVCVRARACVYARASLSQASTHQHGYVSKTPGSWSSLLTYELRRDGFVFITAKRQGSVRTRPLRWLGGNLLLNAECNATEGHDGRVGELRIAVLNATGPPSAWTELPGFGDADAIPFRGNATAATTRWTTGANISHLTGQTVAFSVTLAEGARLYSLRGDFDLLARW